MAKEKAVNENIKDLVNISSIKYVLYALIILFVYVFIVNAWVGDDAYITFRTVDNFINGYGLTWNTGERVQAYTHPLWMFIHSFFYFISGNIYYTTIFLSFVFSFAAIYLFIFKIADNKLNAIAGTVTLIMSKIFIDYTSSGLENPLTYFLIIIFLIFYLKDGKAKDKIFKLSLITALAMLNRMDTVLLFLPGLLYIVAKNRKATNLLYVLCGFIPFIIWEIFSIIYYGFPFPNTYYAKLNTGIPLGEYITQGFHYYSDLFKNDLMSGIVIFCGLSVIIIYSIKYKNYGIYLPLVSGIILYLLYILRIGGDFMSGRFFAAPFLIAVALLCTIPININTIKQIYVLSLFLFVLAIIRLSSIKDDQFSYYEIRQDKNFDVDKYNDYIEKFLHGIEDERNYYYGDTGLLNIIEHGSCLPTFPEVEQAKLTKANGKSTSVRVMIGAFGFFAGHYVNVIDRVALSDPLMSKLKISYDSAFTQGWRIGHFFRKVPAGYIKTIVTGKNQLEDKKLKKYYDKLKIITQSPIFSFDRFTEIWRFNTGYYNYLLHDDYITDELPQLYSGDENSIMIYYLRMGNYYFLKYQDRMALNYYRKLVDNEKWLSRRDASDNIYEKVSSFYLKFHKIDSSIYYAEKGLKYTRTKEKTKYFTIFLSHRYENLNKHKKAYSILSEYLKNYPDDVAVLSEFANLFVLMYNDQRAVEVWKLIIEINPNISYTYLNIFKYYYNNGNYDSAAYYAFKAVEKGEKIDQGILDFLIKYKK
ncbi:hypothetical protein ACFLSQ_11515 [Bacteroidota bacterium]